MNNPMKIDTLERRIATLEKKLSVEQRRPRSNRSVYWSGVVDVEMAGSSVMTNVPVVGDYNYALILRVKHNFSKQFPNCMPIYSWWDFMNFPDEGWKQYFANGYRNLLMTGTGSISITNNSGLVHVRNQDGSDYEYFQMLWGFKMNGAGSITVSPQHFSIYLELAYSSTQVPVPFTGNVPSIATTEALEIELLDETKGIIEIP